MKNKQVRALTYGAVCVGLSFALSYAVLFRMPQGGSITLASLAPIVLYIYLFGFKYGLLATVAFTILQLFRGSHLVNPGQIILDYIIPYMALCLVGLVPIAVDKLKKNKGNRGRDRVTEWGIYIGMAVFTLVRWASQTASGMWFWHVPFWGSVLYNSFGVVDSVIAAIALVALFRSKAFRAELDKVRAIHNTPLKAGVNREGAQDNG